MNLIDGSQVALSRLRTLCARSPVRGEGLPSLLYCSFSVSLGALHVPASLAPIGRFRVLRNRVHNSCSGGLRANLRCADRPGRHPQCLRVQITRILSEESHGWFGTCEPSQRSLLHATHTKPDRYDGSLDAGALLDIPQGSALL